MSIALRCHRYTDFQDVTEKFGVEIIKEQIGRETYYHVGAREFVENMN